MRRYAEVLGALLALLLWVLFIVVQLDTPR